MITESQLIEDTDFYHLPSVQGATFEVYTYVGINKNGNRDWKLKSSSSSRVSDFSLAYTLLNFGEI